MKKKLKPIPDFKDEQEEREFWWTADSTEYSDWDQAVRVTFPRLKMSERLLETEAKQVVND